MNKRIVSLTYSKIMPTKKKKIIIPNQDFLAVQ